MSLNHCLLQPQRLEVHYAGGNKVRSLGLFMISYYIKNFPSCVKICRRNTYLKLPHKCITEQK